ncbi:hypothetical protein J4476_03495 [Candidatus Woesearchaeota archaeon]|nr:hypothetical protein [Candidatus Woesearchaeota archaeon]HIH26312.1 hypothetical protein [Nanoarchaeota archaeon]
MSEDKILVLSSQNDLETDLVLTKLNRDRIPFVRINSFNLNNYRFGLSINNSDSVYQLPFDNKKIRTIWNRMPFSLRGVFSRENSDTENLINEENFWFIRNIGEQIPNALWINHPSLEELANCKLSQLKKAKEVGLDIPDTVLTNTKENVKRLYDKHEIIVFKPLFNSGQLSGNQSTLYTSVVTRERFDSIGDISICPGFFQEYIPKMYDLRIIVVGDDIFPIAIYSQDIEESRIDWRKGNPNSLKYCIKEVPDELLDRSYRLCKRFGIVTAAIDFAVDKEGKHYFLDFNPSGRWMQFELVTGAKISDSIVSLLTNPSQAIIDTYNRAR